MKEELKKILTENAVEMREKAYAPYSNYQVGAALLGDDNKLYLGCNIENAAYSPTICAERVAAVGAVKAGVRKFLAIAIASSGTTLPYPCGVCRQFLNEFTTNMPVLLINKNNDILETTFRELFPNGFSKEDLGLEQE